MLIQVFEKIQAPQITPIALLRLLFEFKKPFDKKIAMDDWNYGGNAKLDYKKLLFFYQYLFNFIFDILDTVFTPYINNKKDFVAPHQIIADDFRVILQFIFIIQNLPIFIFTYNVDFRPFNPIDGDPDRLISNWSNLRGKFLDHKAKINNFKRLKGITEYPIPYRLWRFNKAIKNNLLKQKEFQKDKQLPAGKFFLTFTRHKSHKKSIYSMLEKNKNEWVHKKDMKRSANIKNDDDFRSIISQLRNDIIKQKLTNSLKIENNKKGKYKLTVLAL